MIRLDSLIAFRVSWEGMEGIIAATNKDKARKAYLQILLNAGCATALYRNIRVLRAARYDHWAGLTKEGDCRSEMAVLAWEHDNKGESADG